MLGDDRSDYIQTPRCLSDVPPLQYSLNAHHNHQYLLDQGSLCWMMYRYGNGNWTLRAEKCILRACMVLTSLHLVHVDMGTVVDQSL